MDAHQFAYWLQGFAELNEHPPSAEQWKSIREHLATVFVKTTPQFQPVIRGGVYAAPATTPLRAECMARPVGAGDGDTYLTC